MDYTEAMYLGVVGLFEYHDVYYVFPAIIDIASTQGIVNKGNPGGDQVSLNCCQPTACRRLQIGVERPSQCVVVAEIDP